MRSERLSLDEGGTPVDIRVLKPLRFGLSEKAVEAIRQWRFTPAKRSGRPVPYDYQVAVPFRIGIEGADRR